MQESAMTFDGTVLSPQKEVVRVFFKEMWDKADKSLIPTIFHRDFTFRGSLGPVLRGYDQFAGYVDMVTGALGQYTSDILDWLRKTTRSSRSYTTMDIIAVNCSDIRRPGAMCGGTEHPSLHSTAARCAISGYSATCTD